MEQWGRRLEGLEAVGTRHGQWGLARQWGGRGVWRRDSGSGKGVEEGIEADFKEGRKETTAREI
jgi:hypothetical protein